MPTPFSITLQDFRLVDPQRESIPYVQGVSAADLASDDTAITFLLIKDAESYEGWTNGLMLACCVPGHLTKSHWDDLADIYENSGQTLWVEVVVRHAEQAA